MNSPRWNCLPLVVLLVGCGDKDGTTDAASSTGTTGPGVTSVSTMPTMPDDTTSATDPTGVSDGSSASSSTGPVEPTTGEPTTGTSTGESASTGTTEVEGSATDTNPSDTNGECDSTCGVSIECEHPDVPESRGAEACMAGFHCTDASACGCAVTACFENCDPQEPKSCPGKQTCDQRTGECVDK